MKKIISFTPQALSADFNSIINSCKETCKECHENVELAVYIKDKPNTHQVIAKFRRVNNKLVTLYNPTAIAEFGLSKLFSKPSTPEDILEDILAYACEESGLADACRRSDKLDKLVHMTIEIALSEFSKQVNK